MNNDNNRPQQKSRRATNPGAARRPVNPGSRPQGNRPSRSAGGNTTPVRNPRPQQKSTSRAKKHYSLRTVAVTVVAAAAVCVLITFLVLFLLGFRYMSYKVNRAGEEITIKYVGRVDKDGNPYDGTVIYPDKTGKLAEDTESDNSDLYTIAYSNGDVYRGYLKKALKHGWGVVVYANGDRYEGNFSNDVISGADSDEYPCIYTYANGDVYRGDFENGQKHGYGKMTFDDSDDDPDNNPYYEGQFVSDLRSGEGTNVYSDGSVYVGTFEKDLRNGYGEFTWANGDSYKGDFVEGVRTGTGIYTWANGDSYNGDFVDGDMSGEGTYTLANGKSYQGKFENGQIVIGEGSIIDLTPGGE